MYILQISILLITNYKKHEQKPGTIWRDSDRKIVWHAKAHRVKLMCVSQNACQWFSRTTILQANMSITTTKELSQDKPTESGILLQKSDPEISITPLP